MSSSVKRISGEDYSGKDQRRGVGIPGKVAQRQGEANLTAKVRRERSENRERPVITGRKV